MINTNMYMYKSDKNEVLINLHIHVGGSAFTIVKWKYEVTRSSPCP